MIKIDPDGQAWKPTISDGIQNGYEWVPDELSYDTNGNLHEGLYEQAIFFTNNHNFDENSSFNMGSSSAIVYKADGTKAVYPVCTLPSDATKYATVPEGIYEAKVGKHRNSYTALRMSDIGTSNFSNNRIELGIENPAYSDGRTYATGINIHKAGKNDKTGMTTKGKPISAGCTLISREQWRNFISNFNTDSQKQNIISVTISRTCGTALNSNRNTPAFHSTQADNTQTSIWR